jgi:hypothetical protein
MFGGVVPKELVLPRPALTVADVHSRDVRDLETEPEVFTRPDQILPWVREWPTDIRMDPAALLGQRPEKK